jgi:hypothetical protein
MGIIGQVPGQVYNAQVIDENSKGLKAAFFYLDANGAPISNDTLTDDNGNFHFTYPTDNADKIFIQFYSFDEYQPYVATFDELVHEEKVILKSKSSLKNSSINTTIALAGLGIAIISLQRKKIGASKATMLYQNFNKQSNEKKLMTVGGLAIGGYLIYQLFKYKPTPDQKATLADAQKMLDILHFQHGIDPSLPVVQYTSFATEIKTAVDDCGTDEETIFRVFNSLNNEADIYLLIVKYGVKAYTGCFQFEGPRPTDILLDVVHRVLPETIIEELSDTDIQKINSILSDKGIQYRF